MKFLVVAFALVAVAAAQHQHVTPVPIAILRQSQDSSPDGAYQYSFDTENGIHVDEQGQPGAVGEEGTPAIVARGSFSYTGPDGTAYQVTYTADETGFHPEGAHLPVAPPVPEEILRALDYNAAHPEENDGTLSGNFQPASAVRTVPTPQGSQGFVKPNFGRRF